MPTWDSAQYLKFEKERTQPARDLVARLAGLHPNCIVDLGCGPGNSTAVVAAAFPDARVVGVDSSPDMVCAARAAHPSLAFELFDATGDFSALPVRPDLLFSNACIQWVPDNEGLVKRMLAALVPGGTLAVQVPVNAHEPIHRTIDEVVDTPRWRDVGIHKRMFHTLDPLAYFDLLAREAADFTLWKIVYCHRMASVDRVVEWMRGTGMRPYLDQLQGAQREAFVADVKAALERELTVRPNGEIAMEFPRLFFVAQSKGASGDGTCLGDTRGAQRPQRDVAVASGTGAPLATDRSTQKEGR